jgi:hypothetical protein
LEPESVNECTFKKGSYYSLGATVTYILLACLAPNLPSSPGEKDGGCCIYTRWEKNGTNGNSDGQQPAIFVNQPVDPELPGTVTANESYEVATRSVNEGRLTAIHADGSLESKSVTVRPDGSVHVEVRSSDGTGSESVRRWVYPNEAAARFAGHITDTFDEEEEQVEVDVDPVEEWDNAEELVSALQHESGHAVTDESSTSTHVATNGSHIQELPPCTERNSASNSVLFKPDGTVDVAITTPNEDGPPSIQALTYPSENAARAAGHL